MNKPSWSKVRLLALAVSSSFEMDPTGKRFANAVVNKIQLRFFPNWWRPRSEMALDPKSAKVETSSILFVIHVHYPDMLETALEYLRSLPMASTKVVTTTSQEASELSQGAAVLIGHKTILVPNQGRNFGPLLDVLTEYKEWEYLVHLHTKKSMQDFIGRGDQWNAALWSELGNPETAINAVEILHQHSKYGVAYPDVSAFVTPMNFQWNHNAKHANELLEQIGLKLPEGPIAFPAGGMFAIKRAAILPLVTLGLASKDMPLEPIAVDGTILHAIERLIGVVPSLTGYEHVVIRGGRFFSDTSYTAGAKSLFKKRASFVNSRKNTGDYEVNL